MADETKVLYHIDGEKTPYLVKLSIEPSKVTLSDLKAGINKKNCRYYFEIQDEEFG